MTKFFFFYQVTFFGSLEERDKIFARIQSWNTGQIEKTLKILNSRGKMGKDKYPFLTFLGKIASKPCGDKSKLLVNILG